MFMPFIECYESGEGTPNPDVYCNSYIKFSSLREHVINKLGFDKMATGHYARLGPSPGGETDSVPQLKRGVDPTKDQSYFLCTTEVCVLVSCICALLVNSNSVFDLSEPALTEQVLREHSVSIRRNDEIASKRFRCIL